MRGRRRPSLSLAVRVGAPLACEALPLLFALFQLFQWVNYSGSVSAKERALAAATNRYAREEHQRALDSLKGLQTQRLLATVGLVLAVGISGGGARQKNLPRCLPRGDAEGA